ncbi:hypothetical protein HPP92_008528 [Vanilla planifolia]|uniref:Protein DETOXIFICATION n=1 Tax=Vanilla planifolia TaxID=51239 RepID=A0A835RDV3_VANPL|nr:hypothetical protein HPP92_008717 [Vanilla planifolia]KAG0486433.1 hypothetical protein HPP92_008528 [Vanilla planifolia]
MCNTACATVAMAASGEKAPCDAYITLLSYSEANKVKTCSVAMEETRLIQLPDPSETMNEAGKLFHLSLPIALTALLVYSRSIVSMLFLGSLGELPLAAGSLAIAFANITGYSVLSGLSLGMEPICSQAFGANQRRLLALTLHRSILFLLCSVLPISLLWLSMSKILLFLKQDEGVTKLAHTHLLFSIPDLFSFSFIHPIRIYLRSQSITRPVTLASASAAFFHLPANLLLVTHLKLGISGVAAAAASTNLFLLCSLLFLSRAHLPPWRGPAEEKLAGWGPLACLAAPSCASVCLEWWWYELMILLCGLLPEPKPALAAMGVLIQTTSLVYVFPSSLGFGTSARVGNELGANRPAAARGVAATALAASAAMGMAAMGFGFVMSERWGRMFTTDEKILKLTAAALPIIGLCELGNCPQTVGCGVLRGTARPSMAANVNLGAFYFVGLPVAVVMGFGFGFGFRGLWLGLLAAQGSCAAFMMYAVKSTDWEAQANRAQSLAMAADSSV